MSCTGEGATPRASRLSAEGRAGSFPYDNPMQMAEPSQAQQAGPGAIPSGRLGDRQDGYADVQGAVTVFKPVAPYTPADQLF